LTVKGDLNRITARVIFSVSDYIVTALREGLISARSVCGNWRKKPLLFVKPVSGVKTSLERL
jgi:hypothetical protein